MVFRAKGFSGFFRTHPNALALGDGEGMREKVLPVAPGWEREPAAAGDGGGTMGEGLYGSGAAWEL